ncbi:hypothetical protein JW968_06965 [Candidatus Woesearchaeota archaeon]|nr:hypothetical protein [Candidatus Woesearchaeota archaeon]
MPKKCIICHEKADFCIKDSSDFYCADCAKEYFADTSLLITVEEQAKRLKELIDDPDQL